MNTSTILPDNVETQERAEKENTIISGISHTLALDERLKSYIVEAVGSVTDEVLEQVLILIETSINAGADIVQLKELRTKITKATSLGELGILGEETDRLAA